jgi:hypothetical protein
MRHLGKYTFFTEQERAADYRARVGNLSAVRTVTPDPQEIMEEWVERVKNQHNEGTRSL